jgi:hypothetical protein
MSMSHRQELVRAHSLPLTDRFKQPWTQPLREILSYYALELTSRQPTSRSPRAVRAHHQSPFGLTWKRKSSWMGKVSQGERYFNTTRYEHTLNRCSCRTPYGLDESLPNKERGILHIEKSNYWKFYNLEYADRSIDLSSEFADAVAGLSMGRTVSMPGTRLITTMKPSQRTTTTKQDSSCRGHHRTTL